MSETATEADGEEHRAGWFELFFDLVFVVTVAVLAHGLHGNPDAGDFGTFLVLFFPAWWAWVNLMVTVNVFGSAARMQAMLIGAMPGLGLMAAAAPEGLGHRAWAYALGAAWVRLALFAIWWGHARRQDNPLPLWRPLSYCLVPAGLWAVSAAVPSPWRFVLWGVAIALEVALLAVTTGLSEEQLYRRLSAEHLVERISLFVVIVLGESVFTVVATFADNFTGAAAAAALLGFLVVAELALVFFVWGTAGAARGLDRAQAGQANQAIRDTVMYLPFVLIAGITVLSGALGTAVAEPDHHLPPGARWALCGGVIAFYTANAAMSLRYRDPARSVFGWYVPCLALVLGVLLPAAVLLPAWGAVGVAAAVVFALTKLAKYRLRRRAAGI